MYEEMGRSGDALKQAREFRSLTDSVFNSEKHNELASREANYLFQKKEIEERNKHENEMAQAESDRKRQNIIISSVLGGLVLVIIFSFFLYKRFRIVKSQKQMIEEQKELVEEKQKEIMDSIHYAKRIQLSLLPNEKTFQKTLLRLKKD
jgi:Fe2+ transport system protein B